MQRPSGPTHIIVVTPETPTKGDKSQEHLPPTTTTAAASKPTSPTGVQMGNQNHGMCGGGSVLTIISDV